MKHKNIEIGRKFNINDAFFILFGVRQSFFLKKSRKYILGIIKNKYTF